MSEPSRAFTVDGSNPELIQNGELVLTLTESGGGTRLSSTREVLYGTITASIKTVGAPGVVTAFITMSGAKDEIDAEWTGTDTDEVQVRVLFVAWFPSLMTADSSKSRSEQLLLARRRRQLLSRWQSCRGKSTRAISHIVSKA